MEWLRSCVLRLRLWGIQTGLGLRENPGGVCTGLGRGSPWGRRTRWRGLKFLSCWLLPHYLDLVNSLLQEEVSIPNSKSYHCRVAVGSVVTPFIDYLPWFVLNFSIIIFICSLVQAVILSRFVPVCAGPVCHSPDSLSRLDLVWTHL